MATIILNETSFALNTFNRNTNFSNDSINSYAYFSINYDNSAEALYELGESTITSIVIKNSMNETIYELNNINAKINSIDENLNGEEIYVNVNIQFNQ